MLILGFIETAVMSTNKDSKEPLYFMQNIGCMRR